MRKSLILVLLILLAFPITANAILLEQPQPYKDLHLQFERQENDQAPWYNDGIVFVTLRMIMKGYQDGTFRAGDVVNRAELATILERYDQNNRVENNLGARLWQVYENDFYSLYFPQNEKGAINIVQSADSCSMYVPDGNDVRFLLTCYDASKTTVDALLQDMGRQFSNTRRSVEDIEIGGVKGKKATALSLQKEGDLWESSYIFVTDEKKQKIYMMSSSIRSAEDDRIVKSFQIK